MAYKFPYVNFHDFNLDWLVKKVRSAVYYVNNNPPDEYGNVNITVTGGVKTVNGFGPDAAGEVKAGTVRSVNGKSPMSLPTPGEITLTAADVGALPDSTTIPAPASNLPSDLGVAYTGTSTKYARQDHVHKMPSAADVGALPSSTTIPSPALNVPENLGTATRGTSTRYARQDHVHNMPSAADVGALPDSTVIPVAATGLPENLGIAAIGTSTKYAKEDHVHNMCVQTDSGTYNLNNFTDPGLFFFSGASTLSNQPSGNAAGWLLVLPAGSSLQKQLWFRSSVTGVTDTYQRLNNGGTWTSWVRFSTDNDTQNGSSDVTDTQGTPAHKHLYKVNHIVYFEYQSASRVWAAQEQICTIPSGYRPSDTFVMTISNNGVAGNVIVNTNGNITLNQLTTLSGNSRIYINGWWYV